MRLTLEHFKKSAKRHAEQTGQPLSKSQEDLAVAFGFKSFHDVVQRLGTKSDSPGKWLKKPGASSVATVFVLCTIVGVLPSFLGTGIDTMRIEPPQIQSADGQAPHASAESITTVKDSIGEVASQKAIKIAEPSPAKSWQEVQYRASLEVDSSMQKAYTGLLGACVSPCDVIDSSLEKYSSSVKMRMPQAEGPKLMERLGTFGEVVFQQQTQTDRTKDVVDADAQIQNLAAYRDQLRQLLSQAKSTEGAIEINRELHQVQAQLDSAKGVRAELRERTEMVTLDVQLHSSNAVRKMAWLSLRNALTSFGEKFLESLASIVSSVALIAPWLMLAGLGWIAYCRFGRVREITSDFAINEEEDAKKTESKD